MGHQFLQREFGINPKIAWHVDAFGHTMGTAEVFKDLGYEGFFFSRINEKEKPYRKSNQLMEFYWKSKYQSSSGTAPSDNGIFTHVFHHHYSPDCGITL